MEFKTYMAGYLVLLVILSIMGFITTYLKPVTYSDKLKPIDQGYLIVYDGMDNPIQVVHYLIYNIMPLENQINKPLIEVKRYLYRTIYDTLVVEDSMVEAVLTRVYPVTPPSVVMELLDYYSIFKNKFDLVELDSGLNNYTGYLLNVKPGYLLVVVTYFVDQNSYVNITRYLPPIVYYPNPPPPPDLLYVFVEKALNDLDYANMLNYMFAWILREMSSIQVRVKYTLSQPPLKFDYLLYGWLVFIGLIELYEPRAIIIFSKELFYRVKTSIHYIRRALRRLKQYMVELYRI